MFRLCRSRRLGGLETDPLTVIDVVEELARHDGSAAWCALNCGIAGVLQSFLASEGASEIGASHDVVVNGVIAPAGRAAEVDGGYRVSGRWSFVGNSHHCTWLALSCVVVAGDGATAAAGEPRIVMTFVPASQWRIFDTWDTVGLRATGSHDVDMSDVFVPEHRAISIQMSEPVQDGALFRFPLVGLFSVGMAACALGLEARRSTRCSTSHVRRRRSGCPRHSRPGQPPDRDVRGPGDGRLGRCAPPAGDRPHVAGRAGRWAAHSGATGALAHRRHPRGGAAAAAVDRAFTAAGSSAIFGSNPLQRCLRDIRTLTQHFFLAPPTYEMTGKVLLGVEPDGFML